LRPDVPLKNAPLSHAGLWPATANFLHAEQITSSKAGGLIGNAKGGFKEGWTSKFLAQEHWIGSAHRGRQAEPKFAFLF
jgi:hypothetical protein